MMPNPYEVLGLATDADQVAIKAAYRALARKYHPDLNKSAAAAPQFLAVKEAYEVLSDPAKKASVDSLLQQATRPQASTASPKRPGPSSTDTQTSAKAKKRTGASTGGVDSLRLTMLLNRGRYVEAEKLARLIVREAPTNALAYAAIADIAQMRGDVPTAAKYYAFAAQYDPKNTIYQRRHEEMLAGLSDRSQAMQSASAGPSVMPIGVGVFLITVMAAYVVLAKRELPLFPEISFISEWTSSLLVMLLLGGVTAGASLSASGLLARFDASRGSAVIKAPPSFVLAVISVVSFWASVVLYVGLGMSQHSFNPSLSRLLASVVAVVGVLSLAALSRSDAAALQTLAWGGNLAYIGAAFGWFVADLFRRAIDRD